MSDESVVQPMKRLPSLKGDDSRRRQFKARSKDLERGVSAPILSPGSEAKAPLPLSTKEAVSVGHGKGHHFVKKTFFQPTFCHHCAELLWGLKGQGMKCPGNKTHGGVLARPPPVLYISPLQRMDALLPVAVLSCVGACLEETLIPCIYKLFDILNVHVLYM